MTKEQRRAKMAYELIQEQQNELDSENYYNIAQKLPILIKKAGLIQALSFIYSRGDHSQKKLLEHLAEQLYNEQFISSKSIDILLTTVQNASILKYIRLTQESLAILLWHKRFSQSLLKNKENDLSQDKNAEKI